MILSRLCIHDMVQGNATFLEVMPQSVTFLRTWWWGTEFWSGIRESRRDRRKAVPPQSSTWNRKLPLVLPSTVYFQECLRGHWNTSDIIPRLIYFPARMQEVKQCPFSHLLLLFVCLFVCLFLCLHHPKNKYMPLQPWLLPRFYICEIKEWGKVRTVVCNELHNPWEK